MAKKKRAAKRASSGWDAQRFGGHTFVFTGSFPYNAPRGTGPSAAEKKAAQLHQQGAAIETQGDQIDATTVDDWVEASRISKPDLDKDVMSETLLRYKGAEAGEVDWRPTETVPEDYYAF